MSQIQRVGSKCRYCVKTTQNRKNKHHKPELWKEDKRLMTINKNVQYFHKKEFWLQYFHKKGFWSGSVGPWLDKKQYP